MLTVAEKGPTILISLCAAEHEINTGIQRAPVKGGGYDKRAIFSPSPVDGVKVLQYWRIIRGRLRSMKSVPYRAEERYINTHISR
mmetsp:Transcript_29447/g.54654  ORF Transcript_29447/g.54654 Transcript_29447/m.54654 type:complete len:85 (+) Transcript_29447:2228-2482(+)